MRRGTVAQWTLCIHEYLATDSGGYLGSENLRALIAWLNVSRGGVRFNV